MMTKPTTLLLSLATLTAMFAVPAALADEPNRASTAPELVPATPAGGGGPAPGVPGSGILIFDDYESGPQTARQAADNLMLSYEFTSDPCELADAAEAGEHDLIVVNSIIYIMSVCDAGVFSDLAEFAQGDGTLFFQAWEIDLCGNDGSVSYEVPCSAASVDELFGALGVARPLTTHFEPVTLQATETVAACGLLPSPFVPTVDTMEPEDGGFIRHAQGVTADGATPCFTSASSGEGQVLVNGNGAYIGVNHADYEDTATTTLPGPDDMVKLYEDLFVRYLV